MSIEFVPNQFFGNFISFDDTNRCFKLKESGEIIGYNRIDGYGYIEEKGNMGKGGIARAFSVGLLGDNQGLFIATKMGVKIVLKQENCKERYINMLITPTKSNNIIYRSLKKSADDILRKLESIQPLNCESNEFTIGYAEELRVLKELVKEEVITEDEYTEKKRQLLGI